MYRKNISEYLASLGIFLILFVLYHSWLKPTYLTKPASEPASVAKTAAASMPTPPDVEHQPILPDTLVEQRQLQRIIPAGEPPPNRHVEALKAIQEELEKHNIGSALSGLQALPADAMADPKARQYIAGLWNNLGILQERVSGTAHALKAYQTAAGLDASSLTAHMNLAHAYWEQRDPRLTQDFLSKLIAMAPDEAFPHLAMADYLQERDRLTEAAKHLEQASERASKDPNLKSYLDSVTAKVKRTATIEQKFSSQATTHFIVKYDGEEDQMTWMAVLDILEDAYRDISQKLDFFPTKPIYVVLHTKDSFRGATGSPAWADGLYDPVLGRIQIPTQGALTDKTWLTRVLRHEFVHALLSQRMGSEAGTLPTWLNEGLAMQLAGDPWPDIDQMLQGANLGEVKLIPLNHLESGWARFNGRLATIAYVEGNSATHYIIDRFGMHAVQEILSALKARKTIGGAIQEKLFMPYDQFQRQWVDTLNVKLGTPKG
ncbi:hypothetical protein YTPLAS18_13180 [Nitrospira sp.]|nr:hypothetical protein YTPLAS18_13180 [Nitrospira sp.]